MKIKIADLQKDIEHIQALLKFERTEKETYHQRLNITIRNNRILLDNQARLLKNQLATDQMLINALQALEVYRTELLQSLITSLNKDEHYSLAT